MKYVFNIIILVIIILITSCSQSLVYNSVRNNSQCVDKEGYWYNNQCWKDFDDEGISNSEIDSVVIAQMKVIKESVFIIDEQTYPLVSFLPLKEDDGMILIAVYKTNDNYKTLVFPTGKKNMENGIFETPVLLFNGDALSDTMDTIPKLRGTAEVNIIDIDNLNMEISGRMSDKDTTNIKEFSFKTNEAILGAGNSKIEVIENEAFLSGNLGTVTYAQIQALIKNHPSVKTIIMTHNSGSVNDAVNMHTGQLLRENGFITKVLSDSDIASGGVDLFCAGKNRIVEKGAKIGVHSWCCVNDLTAIEIPKVHPAHQYQIEYFRMALGFESGYDFYFYTLEAAAFDSIHYMTDEEIKEWNIATEFIETK